MERVKIDGLFSVVPPRKEGRFLAQELWDLAEPDWRTDHNDPTPIIAEVNEAIMRHLRPVLDGMKNPKLRRPVVAGANEDFSLRQRRIPARRGKWQILPLKLEGA
jgi:hypothetical protein